LFYKVLGTIFELLNFKTTKRTINSTDLARISCRMLKIRSADNVMAVATYGRGLYTTTSLSTCTPNLTLTNSYGLGSNLLFKAANTVTANNQVQTGAIIRYQAGDKIDLKEGFEASVNSDFIAYLGSCTTTSARQAANEEATPDKSLEDLLIVYPNPTAKDLSFDYLVNERGRVKLELIDMKGQTVALVVDEGDHSTGAHHANISVTNLPTGDYIAALRTPTQRVSKKVAVQK
jgi:hypothetical protein